MFCAGNITTITHCRFMAARAWNEYTHQGPGSLGSTTFSVVRSSAPQTSSSSTERSRSESVLQTMCLQQGGPRGFSNNHPDKLDRSRDSVIVSWSAKLRSLGSVVACGPGVGKLFNFASLGGGFARQWSRLITCACSPCLCSVSSRLSFPSMFAYVAASAQRFRSKVRPTLRINQVVGIYFTLGPALR